MDKDTESDMNTFSSKANATQSSSENNSDESEVESVDSTVASMGPPPSQVEKFSLPVPQPNFFDFRWNRFLALASSPRKLWNYYKFKGRKRTVIVNYLPITLDVEPVSRCNFHCTMCQVSDWPKYKRAEDMEFEDFKKIIDTQHGLLEVKLQGYGEPMLARDKFFEMVKYARRKHIWVRTTTNASLLHLNDNYKKLIDSGINEVQISIDGTCKETFEKIRRGSKFEKVVENCKLINAYSEEKGVVRTRMWSTMQAGNVGEFFNYIDLAKEMGFKRLTYSLILHGFGQDKWVATNESNNAVGFVTEEMGWEAIERGKRAGIEVTFWRATDKYSTKSVDTLCGWPFERVFISSDLRIVPCCLISNPKTADLGDAKEFLSHWNGPVFQEYRRAHLEGTVPKYCKECYEPKEKKKNNKNTLKIVPQG